MGKWLLVLSLGVAIASASPALAQRGPGGPGGPGGDSVRKLQAEIDKLQAEIKELEARSKKGKEPAARPDERRPFPKGGPGGFGGFAPKDGPGFAKKDGPGGRGPGGFGPGRGFEGFGRGFGGGFGHDSKSLQTQLDHLHAAAKMIDARTKEVEAELKLAKANEARKDDRRTGPPSDREPKGKGRPETKPSSDVEKRLDRIEKVLEEIQKSMRQKR